MIARYSQTRFRALVVVLALGFVVVAVRLVWLQALGAGKWKARAAAAVVRVRDEPARRGRLLDRNGNLLAASEVRTDLGVTDVERFLREAWVDTLAARLSVAPEGLRRRLRAAGPGHAVILRDRVLDARTRRALRRIPLLTFTDHVRRVHPHGDLARRLLGDVTLAGEGSTGLERVFDGELAGRPGQVQTRRDSRGRVLSKRPVSPPVDGSDVVLSLDVRVQSILEEQIEAARAAVGARAAQGIVLDPRNGEVIALAQSQAPDVTDERKLDPARIIAATDAFEPGSTFKIFTAAALLARSVCDTSDVYDGCGRPEQRRSVKDFGGFRIRDVHPVGRVSFRHAFAVSSNIVFATAALEHLQQAEFHQDLRNFGFGERTGCGLPGETTGLLAPVSRWSGRTLPTVAIGQEISVSLLQLVSGYGALITDGRVRIPRFRVGRIDADGYVHIPSPPGRGPVVPASIVPTLRALCREVVQRDYGSGQRARVPGLDVAGKTGTAQVSDGHGYVAGVYTTSFVGFAPSVDPRLLVAVVLHEAHGHEVFGGNSAAPCVASVLRAIASGTEWLDGAAVVAEAAPELAAPDLIGLDVQALHARLQGARWSLAGEIPAAGRVVGQIPPAGTPLAPGAVLQVAWRTPGADS